MEADEIFKKYGRKLDEQINSEDIDISSFSKEYQSFKQDLMPQLSRYEQLCKTLGNIVKINVSEKDRAKIQKQLDVSHAEVTPSQTITLAMVSFILVLLA